MKLKYLVLLLIVGFGLHSLITYKNTFVIYPDESLWLNTAHNLATGKGYSTDLLKYWLPHIEVHNYFWPPVYGGLLSAWLSLTGFNPLNQRLLSVIIGVAAVVLYAYYSAAVLGKKHLVVLSVLLLVTDFYFNATARFGRPEIVVILFALAALITFDRALVSARKTGSWAIISGILASLALQTHFMGIWPIGTILATGVLHFPKCNRPFVKAMKYTLAGFTLTLTPLLISIAGNVNQFVSHISAVNADRVVVEASPQVYAPEPGILAPLFVIALLVLVLSVKTRSTILTVGLLSTLTIFIVGKMGVYFAYVSLFIYPTLLKLADVHSNKDHPIIKSVTLSILVMVGIINVYSVVDNDLVSRNNFKVYADSKTKLYDIVAPGTFVYLSSFPDFYSHFLDGRNEVTEYPLVPTDKATFLTVLSQVDYILINAHPEAWFVGDALNEYVSQVPHNRINLVGDIDIIELGRNSQSPDSAKPVAP